jgi:membrane protein implicated in regulation of membrane protease activity
MDDMVKMLYEFAGFAIIAIFLAYVIWRVFKNLFLNKDE